MHTGRPIHLCMAHGSNLRLIARATMALAAELANLIRGIGVNLIAYFIITSERFN